MTRRIGVINTGASTLKVALMEAGPHGVRELRRLRYEWQPARDAEMVLRTALGVLGELPDAFGHRIVHGGPRFTETTTLTSQVEAELDELAALAPLHNLPALAAVSEVRRIYPEVINVAVFDTAFHARRPAESMQYALPRNVVDAFSIRRYGFHGLAHASLLDALAETQETSGDRISCVTLQLGAGCSACAIRQGRSIETSMGYTPLEGLVMATRCGDVDPAAVLRLVRAGYSADRIEDELARRSGLLALCGRADMREILAAALSGHEDAIRALDLFCRRIVLTVGAYFTLLNGEGALVFGGGIGTHAPHVRERIARGLIAWGVELDGEKNRRNEPGPIHASGSRPVFVFETDEEAVIARLVERHIDVPNGTA